MICHFPTPLPLHLLSIKMIEPPDLSMEMMDSVRDTLSPSNGVKPEPSRPSTTAAILETCGKARSEWICNCLCSIHRLSFVTSIFHKHTQHTSMCVLQNYARIRWDRITLSCLQRLEKAQSSEKITCLTLGYFFFALQCSLRENVPKTCYCVDRRN